MIRDDTRMNAHVEALRRAVKAGDTVVDIGAGTGIFSLIACQLGARHVYAIEPNPLIALGRSMAKANGFEDRITFIQDISTRVNLPEKADVVIGDLRGILPLYRQAIPAFADARQRLLKPDGILIPEEDRIYLSLLEAPDSYHGRVLTPWLENAYKLDLSAGFPFQVNMPMPKDRRVEPEQLVLPGQLWETFRYGTRTDPGASKTLSWTAEREATAHFIYAWFDATLYQDIGYTNAPGVSGAQVYGNWMFPLKKPLDVKCGDTLEITLGAYLTGDDYMWRWSVKHTPGSEHSDSRLPQTWDHSTFYSSPLVGKPKRADEFAPVLNQQGHIAMMVLEKMRQRQPLDAIVADLQKTFPETFTGEAAATARVAQLAALYSSQGDE